MNDNEHTPQQDMTPAIESKNRYVLPETKKRRKKAPLIIGIISAVVLAAVLVSVLFWWSNRETEGPVDVTSGVRMGTAALTTRGMKEDDMLKVGGWIVDVLSSTQNETRLGEIRAEVEKFASRFPLFAW